jgi:transcriptional regulator with XRE-family HTH domain
MAARSRPRLAKRRRTQGFTQESLAAELGADRSTIARWERGDCDPQPYYRAKLVQLLHVTPEELDELLTPEPLHGGTQVSGSPNPLEGRVIGHAVTKPDSVFDELEDMNRRELLRLLSLAGTLVAVPNLSADALTEDSEEVEQFELLNSHLWQVFALSPSKRTIYPVVRQQLGLLTGALKQAHSQAVHSRLCVLTGDLLQLAGEILFDADKYTDAAHCYKLAADASKEGNGFDQWACALTRHAYLSMYERRFDVSMPLLEGAARVAQRGDSQLSTRYWVAAVQAEAHAGLGDFNACQRALDTTEQVQSLTGRVMPGGWLRFDGTRLAEERGTCYAALGRTDLASSALVEALKTTTSLRRRGSILTDLAMLGVQAKDLDQALDYGMQAAELADQTRSSGYVGRKLQGLRAELAPVLPDNRASQLSDRIAQL